MRVRALDGATAFIQLWIPEAEHHCCCSTSSSCCWIWWVEVKKRGKWMAIMLSSQAPETPKSSGSSQHTGDLRGFMQLWNPEVEPHHCCCSSRLFLAAEFNLVEGKREGGNDTYLLGSRAALKLWAYQHISMGRHHCSSSSLLNSAAWKSKEGAAAGPDMLVTGSLHELYGPHVAHRQEVEDHCLRETDDWQCLA